MFLYIKLNNRITKLETKTKDQMFCISNLTILTQKLNGNTGTGQFQTLNNPKKTYILYILNDLHYVTNYLK